MIVEWLLGFINPEYHYAFSMAFITLAIPTLAMLVVEIFNKILTKSH